MNPKCQFGQSVEIVENNWHQLQEDSLSQKRSFKRFFQLFSSKATFQEDFSSFSVSLVNKVFVVDEFKGSTKSC